MAFPFPNNPVDGQTVSHLDVDGSLLKATYNASKNTWNVERELKPQPMTLARSGVSIPTATADKQVMMWDATANQWVASSIALSTKDLGDVDPTAPAQGYILVYDGGLKKYKPVPLTGGSVLTATTVGVQARISGGAADVNAALTALYKLAKPAALTPAGGDAYVINAVKGQSALDKYAGTYLYNGTAWVLSAGSGGGASAHYRASSTTPQEPGVNIGDLDILNEPLNAQINVFDGAVYQTVLGETRIKQWIAAGSLFQGTLTTNGDLAGLPTAGPTNRGFYWTWTGAASHAITSPLTATLQVGDWIQSDGAKYIHVPSDLMSKQRWESVGSFRTWADGSYEASTLVYHNNGLYRATAAINPGDPEPGALTPNNWQKIPLSLAIEELTNVNDNVAAYGSNCVFVWSEIDQEWTASRSLEIDDITFDESGPGNTLTGFAQFNMKVPAPFTEDTWVPSVMAVKDAIAGISIESLVDAKELSNAADGDAVTYNATQNRWEPKSLAIKAVADIGDVNITAIPNDGEVLSWNTATSKWIPTHAPNELNDLTDVRLSALADGQVLKFDLAANEWHNSASAALSEWSSSDAYAAGQTVLHSNNLWYATKDIASGIEPGAPFNPTVITRGTKKRDATFGTASPGLTDLETFDGSIPSWGLGDYYYWTCIDTLPYVVTTGIFAGTTITRSSGYVVLVDKDGTDGWKGTKGWLVLQAGLVPPTLTVSDPSPWKQELTDSYSKIDVERKLSALASKLSHGEAVINFLAQPPATSVEGAAYIVGLRAKGSFTGQENTIAQYINGAWVFTAPLANETHFVEELASMWTWNSSSWVKVAEVGLKMQVISAADYNALVAKDNTVVYLVKA